jgi:hypothetical protein
MGDATQLHQIAMNLCSNAIQAMSAGGTLRVALEAVDVATERVLSHGTFRPGPHVCPSVDDSGSGMEEATLSCIFEPFFTTKETGRGTGLGVSIVYVIVTDCGGVIDVKSVVKHGSTFAIYLPLVAAERPRALATVTLATRTRSGSRTDVMRPAAVLGDSSATSVTFGRWPETRGWPHARSLRACPGRRPGSVQGLDARHMRRKPCLQIPSSRPRPSSLPRCSAMRSWLRLPLRLRRALKSRQKPARRKRLAN